MFFTKLFSLVRQWWLVQHHERQANKRNVAVAKNAIAKQFPPAKLVSWKGAGTSHLVVHATSSHTWSKQHQLWIIDLDFEHVAGCLPVRPIEQWSLQLEADVLHISICHSLTSLWPEAYSFWKFDLKRHRMEEDLEAKLQFLADLDR